MPCGITGSLSLSGYERFEGLMRNCGGTRLPLPSPRAAWCAVGELLHVPMLWGGAEIGVARWKHNLRRSKKLVELNLNMT